MIGDYTKPSARLLFNKLSGLGIHDVQAAYLEYGNIKVIVSRAGEEDHTFNFTEYAEEDDIVTMIRDFYTERDNAKIKEIKAERPSFFESEPVEKLEQLVDDLEKEIVWYDSVVARKRSLVEELNTLIGEKNGRS